MRTTILLALSAVVVAACTGDDAASSTIATASTTTVSGPTSSTTIATTSTTVIVPDSPDLLVTSGNAIVRYPDLQSAATTAFQFECPVTRVMGDDTGNLFFEACHPDGEGVYFLRANSLDPQLIVSAWGVGLEELSELNDGPTLFYTKLLDDSNLVMETLNLQTGEVTSLGTVGHLEEAPFGVSATNEAVSFRTLDACTQVWTPTSRRWNDTDLCEGTAFVERTEDGRLTYVKAEGEMQLNTGEMGPPEVFVADSAELLIGVPVTGGEPAQTIPLDSWRVTRVDQVGDTLLVSFHDTEHTFAQFPSPFPPSSQILISELDSGNTRTVTAEYGALTKSLSPFASELSAFLASP